MEASFRALQWRLRLGLCNGGFVWGSAMEASLTAPNNGVRNGGPPQGAYLPRWTDFVVTLGAWAADASFDVSGRPRVPPSTTPIARGAALRPGFRGKTPSFVFSELWTLLEAVTAVGSVRSKIICVQAQPGAAAEDQRETTKRRGMAGRPPVQP